MSFELRQRGGGAPMQNKALASANDGHYYESNNCTTSKVYTTKRVKRRRMRYTAVGMVVTSCILLVVAKCFLFQTTRTLSDDAVRLVRQGQGSAHRHTHRHRRPMQQQVDLTEDKKIQADMDSLQESQSAASDFKLPRHILKPGELAPLVWKSDGKQVDKYARFIGIPPQLTTEIHDFCVRTGLMDLFWKISYSNDKMGGQSSRILDNIKTKGKWAVTSPGQGSNWSNSNLHWFDVVDEAAYEETLRVLKRGGFDAVLEAIGHEFQNESLMIAGVGFIVVSHSQGSQQHSDDPGVEERFFDLLFPLLLPENDVSQLYIGDDTDSRISPVNFTRNTGILMSGDTAHKTGDCDYRETKGLRVAVTIYIADLNDEIAEVVAGDGTALFPVPGNTEWLLTQKGRSWGGGTSLEHDMGRLPYTAKDKDEKGCPALARAGMCEKDPSRTRTRCQKSCGIFIEDDRYYSEVIGGTIS